LLIARCNKQLKRLSGVCFVSQSRQMSSSKSVSGRKVNSDSDGPDENYKAEADSPTVTENPSRWGPVREPVQVSTSGACFCPPPAFCPEMDPTEWLEKLEDFFCVSGVPTSNYGVVGRYLLSDPVRRVLYPVGQARDSSFEELKIRLLNAYGLEESPVRLIERFQALRQREGQSIQQYAQEVAELGRRAGVSERDLMARFVGGIASREVYRAIRLQEPLTLAEARKLAIRIIQVEEDFQERQQPRAGITKPEKAEAAQSIDALIREMGNLARKVEQLERTSARPARTAAGCFHCGSLDHLRRDCPQLRARTRPAGAQRSGSTDRRLLAMTESQAGCSPLVAGKLNGLRIPLLLDSGAVVSVVSESTWRSATKGQPLRIAEGSILLGDGRKMCICGLGVMPLQLGSWSGRVPVVVVKSLVVPGILGTNFFDLFVKVVDWQARRMTMTDGSKVEIKREAAPNKRLGIGCALVTPNSWEAGAEKTTEGKPDTGDGDLEEWGRSLVDGAECSPRGKRAFSGVLRRCGKAISRSEADLRRTNLIQHQIETSIISVIITCLLFEVIIHLL
ncbi:hypothetical protein T10_3024, partial [Trichinella papuae]